MGTGPQTARAGRARGCGHREHLLPDRATGHHRQVPARDRYLGGRRSGAATAGALDRRGAAVTIYRATVLDTPGALGDPGGLRAAEDCALVVRDGILVYRNDRAFAGRADP